MIIREFKKEDKKEAEEIFAMYWTDSEFLKKLSDKLQMSIEKTEEFLNKKYKILVADDNNEIVGIIISRSSPNHMKEFTKTINPAELYLIASKNKNKGIGLTLLIKILEEVKNLNFTEIVLYSPDSHKDSWGFYDGNDFERIGSAIAPDGEPGQIWRKIISPVLAK